VDVIVIDMGCNDSKNLDHAKNALNLSKCFCFLHALLAWVPHTRPTSSKHFTNLKVDVIVIDMGYNDSKNLDHANALNLSIFFCLLHVFTQSLTILSFFRMSVYF
jgi:hypothetical protein